MQLLDKPVIPDIVEEASDEYALAIEYYLYDFHIYVKQQNNLAEACHIVYCGVDQYCRRYIEANRTMLQHIDGLAALCQAEANQLLLCEYQQILQYFTTSDR